MVSRRGTAVSFDGYEAAALERYRDEQERRTGRRPTLATVIRALVRDWAGLSDDGPTVAIRIHDDTQTPRSAQQQP